jgi:hypothetical protein
MSSYPKVFYVSRGLQSPFRNQLHGRRRQCKNKPRLMERKQPRRTHELGHVHGHLLSTLLQHKTEIRSNKPTVCVLSVLALSLMQFKNYVLDKAWKATGLDVLNIVPLIIAMALLAKKSKVDERKWTIVVSGNVPQVPKAQWYGGAAMAAVEV